MTKNIKSPPVVSDALARYEHESAEPAVPITAPVTPGPTIGTWFDVSANAIDGRSNDPTLFDTFAFDGVVDYVICPSPYVPSLAGALPIVADLTSATMECWMKPDAVSGLAANSRPITINSAGTPGYLIISLRTDGQLRCYVNNSNRAHTALGEVTNGVWFHVAMTAATGVAPIIYLNGADVTDVSVASAYPVSTTQITVGATLTGAGASVSQPFNGEIDTARVYNRILSPDEVLKNYYAGLARHQ
jgi:hypothetical protein